MRALIKLVSTGQTGFPDAFAAIVGDTTTPNQTPLSKDWYDSKRNRLRILLTELQGFLSRRPEYAQNPPDLLVGLLTTCNDGREALDKYNQFCNCLESPNAKGCSTLAQPTKSDNQLRIRNRRDWRDDGSDLGDEE